MVFDNDSGVGSITTVLMCCRIDNDSVLVPFETVDKAVIFDDTNELGLCR